MFAISTFICQFARLSVYLSLLCARCSDKLLRDLLHTFGTALNSVEFVSNFQKVPLPLDSKTLQPGFEGIVYDRSCDALPRTPMSRGAMPTSLSLTMTNVHGLNTRNNTPSDDITHQLREQHSSSCLARVSMHHSHVVN
jgi:hypothetical protein